MTFYQYFVIQISSTTPFPRLIPELITKNSGFEECFYITEDIHAIADQSLTDSSNDKKCDLVYVDRDNNYALVAQGYFAQNFSRPNAPSNKASDLNTANLGVLGLGEPFLTVGGAGYFAA